MTACERLQKLWLLESVIVVVKPLQVFKRHTSHVTLQQLELAMIVNLAPQLLLLLIFWQHFNQLFLL